MKLLAEKNIDELAELVGTYPWFAAARKELCLRTGDRETASLYRPSRKCLYEQTHGKIVATVSEREIKTAVESAARIQKKVRAGGGDYFSQEEYDSVRSSGDNIFSSFASGVKSGAEENGKDDMFLDLCTETLAQIYASQGYLEQAKYIYSKLILRYPEKNTYFATLIEKLDEEIKK